MRAGGSWFSCQEPLATPDKAVLCFWSNEDQQVKKQIGAEEHEEDIQTGESFVPPPAAPPEPLNQRAGKRWFHSNLCFWDNSNSEKKAELIPYFWFLRPCDMKGRESRCLILVRAFFSYKIRKILYRELHRYVNGHLSKNVSQLKPLPGPFLGTILCSPTTRSAFFFWLKQKWHSACTFLLQIFPLFKGFLCFFPPKGGFRGKKRAEQPNHPQIHNTAQPLQTQK